MIYWALNYAVVLLLLLVSCGTQTSSGKDEPRAGIEVGNPVASDTILQIEPSFEVEYSEQNPGLFKLTGWNRDYTVELESFNLNLASVRTHASYYFEEDEPLPELGVVVYDSKRPIDFLGNSAGVQFTADTLGLKSISFDFESNPSIADTIAGTILFDNANQRDFIFILPAAHKLDLQFHRAQMLSGSSSNINTLPVILNVRRWFQEVDLTPLNDGSSDLIVFGPGSQTRLYHVLLNDLQRSFNCIYSEMKNYAGGSSMFYTNNYFIKELSQVGVDLIRNGDFSNFSEWILFNQMGGQAKAFINGEGLLVEISDPGRYPWSVQLIQEDIPLVSGAYYSISFEAKSDTPALIDVRLAEYKFPYRAYGKTFVSGLGPEFRTYQLISDQSVWQNDYFARLEMNLGLQPEHLNLGAKVSKIQIRNVQVKRLPDPQN
jgi:hypothetical protein